MKNTLNFGQKGVSGIYQIYNIKTKTFYIGSAFNLSKRYSSHKWLLKHNKHWNKKLQASYNKHGEDNFEFRLLEFCDKQIVIVREQFYFDLLKPYYNYNPVAGNCAGRKLSPKHIERIKEANRGLKRTEEQKRLIGEKNKLQKRTNAEKLHLSKINSGKVITPEVRKKISESTKGKSKPIEFKTPTQKLSIQDVINIKKAICQEKTNKEILSLFPKLPLNMLMLYDIRAARTWSKIKGPCGHFH